MNSPRCHESPPCGAVLDIQLASGPPPTSRQRRPRPGKKRPLCCSRGSFQAAQDPAYHKAGWGNIQERFRITLAELLIAGRGRRVTFILSWGSFENILYFFSSLTNFIGLLRKNDRSSNEKTQEGSNEKHDCQDPFKIPWMEQARCMKKKCLETPRAMFCFYR